MILEVPWDNLWTLSFRLSQFRGSWLLARVWSGPNVCTHEFVRWVILLVKFWEQSKIWSTKRWSIWDWQRERGNYCIRAYLAFIQHITHVTLNTIVGVLLLLLLCFLFYFFNILNRGIKPWAVWNDAPPFVAGFSCCQLQPSSRTYYFPSSFFPL